MSAARSNDAVRVRNGYGKFGQIPEQLIKHTAVSDRAIRLYALLWLYSDPKKRDAWPKRSTLADDLSVSVKTIDRGLAELVDAGALAIDAAFDGNRQTSNVYTILVLPTEARVIHRGVKSVPPEPSTGASNLSPSGASNLTHQEEEPDEEELDLVTEVTTEGEHERSAAASGRTGSSTPANLSALRGHGISTPDIFASVGKLLEPTRLDDEGLFTLAGEIIRKAPTRVVNPTAYVVAAIRNHDTRSEWIARAWVIAGELHLARAGRTATR